MRDPLASVRCAKTLAARKPHGTRSKYRGGCPCLRCRAANAEYQQRRSQRCANGGGNPLVSAANAREHLHRLSSFGIGYRTVHQACGVNSASLARISTGRKTMLRLQTEQRILQVRAVNAYTVWALIDLLCEEGFTRNAILDKLDCNELRACPRRESVTNITAAKVDRLFRSIQA